MVNCVPLNDEREHVHAVDCWCEPVVHWQDDRTGEVFVNGPMIIHNSKDQREVIERLLQDGIEEKQWGVYAD